VYSTGQGNKRGILVSNTNLTSTRDTNIYVAQPTNTASIGSYVGVETADPNNTGSIQLRSTTVGVNYPTSSQSYTASDILQTNPTTIINPTYLASAGIQIGPGTDLVTKSAGGKGFSTYVYPTIIYYGLKGNITSAPSGGYLWPGTQSVSAGSFPDASLQAAYFRAQQPCLISGISGSLNVAPDPANSNGTILTLGIYVLPALLNIPSAVIFTGSISTSGVLTVSSGPSVGSIAVGQFISGLGIASNTYIVSGSGATWTVLPNPSQTVTSTTITSVSPNCSFNGSISGTTLTVTTYLNGTLSVGQYIVGSTTLTGTYIVSQTSSNVWVVNISQTVGTLPVTFYSTGLINTFMGLTFRGTSVQESYYNTSYRLNTGDRISLYVSYTGNSSTNFSHDLTAQIDIF